MRKKSHPKSIDLNKDEIITIPNVVTLVRLIILPFILVALVKENNVTAFLLFAIAGFTDVLDGFLARKLNQISEMGKILDPVIDKIFFLMIAVFLLYYSNFPLWAFLAIIVIEFLILLGGYIAIIKYHFIPVSNYYGKIAAFFLSLTFFMYILDLDLFKSIVFLGISLKYLTLILGVLFLLFALISYYITATKKIEMKVNQDIKEKEA